MRSLSRSAGALLAALTVLIASPAAAQIVDGLQLGCPVRAIGFPSLLSFSVHDVGGFRILVVAGKIAYGDDVRLAQFLRTSGRVHEVWLDSPGGDASVGPKIGRVLREHNLATRIPAGFGCHSSCTFAFMGGVVRNIEPGGAYGVHTFFNDSRVDDVTAIQDAGYTPEETEIRLRQLIHQDEQGNALLAAEWQQYVQEMGISRQFLIRVVIPQQSMQFLTVADIAELRRRGLTEAQIDERRSTIRCLGRDDLLRYNIVNEE